MGKVFVVLTGEVSEGFIVDVLAEDGTPLAEGSCRSGLGVHLAHTLPEVRVAAHHYYPDGYEVVVVPPHETGSHPGLHAALGCYFERGVDATV